MLPRIPSYVTLKDAGLFEKSALGQRSVFSRDSHLQLPKGFFEDTITICRVIFQTFLRQPTHEARYEKRLFVLGVECFERCFVVIRDRDERRLLEWLVCVLDFTDVDPRDLEQRSAEGREQYRSRLTVRIFDAFKARELGAFSLGMLGFLDASLEQLEWCFMHSHALIPSLAGTALSFESRLIDRLIVIIGMLSEFENACMPPSVSDALLRSIGKAYRLLTVVAKTKLKDNETSLSEAFIRLVEAASATMTPRLYSLIPYLQQRDGESVVNKKKNGRGKQHLSSDTKMIPQLIYQIEQFERHLIQVSKRCKVNLARFIKVEIDGRLMRSYMDRSTARDFRIHVQKIADESEEGSDGEGPEKKRARSEEGAAAD
nr:hypothetical protein HK105_005828 [Polyrhizophydium stewartii]